jgi:hypothetical protein
MRSAVAWFSDFKNLILGTGIKMVLTCSANYLTENDETSTDKKMRHGGLQ